MKRPSSRAQLKRKIIDPIPLLVGFIIISLVAFITWNYACKTINEYIHAQSWISNTAIIHTLDINTESGSLILKYKYRFEGETYSGSRVDLNFVNGSDHQSIINEYSRLYDMASRPIQIYTNPSNPNDAVMQRNFPSVSIVFVWVFIVPLFLVGVFFTKIGLGQFIRETTLDSLQKGISSIEGKGFFLYSLIFRVFSFFGFVILLPAMAILYLDRVESFSEVMLLSSAVFIFPLLGLLLYRHGIREKRKFDEIGSSLLTLNPNPATNEGQIGGTIELFSVPQGEFKVTLECSHHKLFGNGKDIRTESDIRWRKSSQCLIKCFGSKRHHLSFVFDLPKNLSASYGENKKRESIIWSLSCTGNVITHGTKKEKLFERSWIIPVVKGKKLSRLQTSVSDVTAIP